jgi:stress-induced morphogen
MELLEKVEKVLRDAFPGMTVSIENMPDGRLSGSVTWAGFAEMDDVDRQMMIRTLLRNELGDDVKRVNILLAHTPDELDAKHTA